MRNKRKIVLAVAWHYSSAKAIAPVIKRLNREGRVDVIVIAHGASEDVFEKDKISYKKARDYEVYLFAFGPIERILDIENPDLVLTGTSVPAGDSDPIDFVFELNFIIAAKNKGLMTLSVTDQWYLFRQRFAYGRNFFCLPDRITIIDEIARTSALADGLPKDSLIITGNPQTDSGEATERIVNLVYEMLGI